MIKVWDLEFDKIEIVDIDGQIFQGTVSSINAVEDEDEDYGIKEDSITVATAKGLITFGQSEIAEAREIK